MPQSLPHRGVRETKKVSCSYTEQVKNMWILLQTQSEHFQPWVQKEREFSTNAAKCTEATFMHNPKKCVFFILFKQMAQRPSLNPLSCCPFELTPFLLSVARAHCQAIVTSSGLIARIFCFPAHPKGRYWSSSILCANRSEINPVSDIYPVEGIAHQLDLSYVYTWVKCDLQETFQLFTVW